MDLIEDIIFKLMGGNKIEKKLLRCQNYTSNSIVLWKKQTTLNWFETFKLLKAIEIFDGDKIRGIIKQIVSQYQDIFERDNLYITSFGSEGKSGGKIAYEFRHTKLIRGNNFVNSWELTQIPENSTIVFVEDLIGTGKQSTKYILEKLNLIIPPSSNPYLFTICATPEGIEKVTTDTNFEIINGILLEKSKYQYYSSECTYFNNKTKRKLININSKLKNPSKEDFDKGLLITFYYSIPNNSMPILWKHNYPYFNEKGKEKRWHALLPRDY